MTLPTFNTDPAAVTVLHTTIDSAFDRRGTLTPEEMDGAVRPAVEQTMVGLESGELRVAEPDGRGGVRDLAVQLAKRRVQGDHHVGQGNEHVGCDHAGESEGELPAQRVEQRGYNAAPADERRQGEAGHHWRQR